MLLKHVRETEASPGVGSSVNDLSAYADSLDRECRRLHAGFVEHRGRALIGREGRPSSDRPGTDDAACAARLTSPQPRAPFCPPTPREIMQAQEFELYLIRHGVAAERGENYPDDTKRPLTNEGVQKLRKEAKALVALDIIFDVILTSPLVRTRQTAEVIAAAFRNAPPIVNMASLAPGSRTTRSSKSSRSSIAAIASRWSVTSRASASSPAA